MKSILDQMEVLNGAEQEEPIGLVGALTKSLCYINKVTNPSSLLKTRSDDPALFPDPRILIISVSPDQSSSYIPIMNSIFSAQKLKVTIDVCKLYGADSVFLQQAAHLTGGSYIDIDRADGLLQYLMTLQRLNAARPNLPAATPARPSTPTSTPANALPRTSSIGLGAARAAANGPPRNGTPAPPRGDADDAKPPFKEIAILTLGLGSNEEAYAIAMLWVVKAHHNLATEG
ncbi:hypothetical protein PHLCEN_2v4258 [Hermanssonia centrifuga]|uniref:General transcription and DNA repair factor IIH subunit TFB4 n=1 Tax=Hermanssonia centrifuga TaxID=98765 RepID=A0A2R6PYX5_9APHY|nr:hypothetical protein PHLCEN_2v4258 [Hermanssonia centrifuga]